jgi:hypothetical protein
MLDAKLLHLGFMLLQPCYDIVAIHQRTILLGRQARKGGSPSPRFA